VYKDVLLSVALQYNHQSDKAFRILMDLHRNPYFNKLPILDLAIRKYHERVSMKHNGHVAP